MELKISEYRELTNQVFSALKSFELCNTERERNYTLSVISRISYEASLAKCDNANRNDLEKMDLALKLVLELIQDNPIPDISAKELQTALH